MQVLKVSIYIYIAFIGKVMYDLTVWVKECCRITWTETWLSRRAFTHKLGFNACDLKWHIVKINFGGSKNAFLTIDLPILSSFMYCMQNRDNMAPINQRFRSLLQSVHENREKSPCIA